MIFENFTKFGPLFRCSNKYKIYLTFFVQLSLKKFTIPGVEIKEEISIKDTPGF